MRKQTVNKQTVNELDVIKLIDDDIMLELEGDLIDGSYIDYLVTEDTDVYKQDGTLLLCFRKNVISPKICNTGYNCFHKAANKISYSRGTAAGPIDINKLPKSVLKLRPMDKNERGVKNTKNWTYYYKKNGEKAKDQTSNGVRSGIVGYYEKFRGLPC
jgi:hypothetical protein